MKQFVVWYDEGYGTSKYICGRFDTLADAEAYVASFSWSRSYFTIEEQRRSHVGANRY